MKKSIAAISGLLIALFIVNYVTAQPVGPIGLQRVAVDGTTMAGSGSSGNPIRATGNMSTVTTTVGEFRGTAITATLAGNENDYAPTGHATATIFNITVTGSNRSITGLQGGASGRRVTFRNVNAEEGFAILFQHEITSTAANRFSLPGGIQFAVRGGDSATFTYNGTTSRWQLEQTRDFYQIFASSLVGLGALSVSGNSSFGTGGSSSTFAGPVTVEDFRGTIITPAITASQNNWAPTGLGDATIINMTSTGGTWSITGLSGVSTGRRLTIRNANAYGGNAIVLVGASGLSDADKQFVAQNLSTGAGGSHILFPGNSVNVFHNGTNWQIEGQGWFQEVTVNGVTSLGTTSTIGLLTASGGITANATNSFNATAGSSTFGDFRSTVISDTITCSASECNDYVPPGAAPNATMILRLSPSGATRTITGLSGGVSGRIVLIVNPAGSGQQLCIAGESASSTSTNRFKPADGSSGTATLCIRASGGEKFFYDGTAQRWQAFSKASFTNIIADTNITSNGGLNVAGATATGTLSVTTTAALSILTMFGTSTTISADQNDWTPNSFNISSHVDLAPTADRLITGLTAGVGGRIVTMHNGTAFNVTLQHDDGATSTATNRFSLPHGANWVIRPYSSVVLRYITNRWRVLTDHNEMDKGIAATPTSCGTGATVTGGTFSGTINVGTGASGCTVTHAAATVGTPSCTVTSRAAINFTYTVSTTALTLTNGSGDLSSTTLDYNCKGH